jgi:uncharacterized protein (TIGR02145 family)
MISIVTSNLKFNKPLKKISMKKFSTLLLAAFALLAMAASCSENEEPNKPPVDPPAEEELALTPTSVNAAVEAGTYSVTITGNVAWTATVNADWLTVTPASGNNDGAVTLSVAENVTIDSRTATLTVAGGELSRTVTVTQLGVAPYLGVSPPAIAAENVAGNYTFDIMSNLAWTATVNADWLTVAPPAGEGDAEITVSVADNTDTEPRTATITITAGEMTESVTVTQEAGDPVVAVETPPYALTTGVWVIGNQTWSSVIQVPDCDKDDFYPSLTVSHCRSLDWYGVKHYYYNWPYVKENAEALCPTPWRVPASTDFEQLDIALGGSGQSRTDDWEMIDPYMSIWGLELAGAIGPSGAPESQDEMGKYWSSTQTGSSDSSSNAYFLLVNASNGFIHPQNNDYKDMGHLVRCVRDN